MKKTNIGQLTTYKTDSISYNFLDIKRLTDLGKLNNIKDSFLVMGGGSNLLMKDDSYENISFIRYSLQKDWKLINKDEYNLYYKVYTGENLSQTILKSNEFTNQMNPLFGLPGTLGGAIIGNAGSFGKEIGEFIESIELYNINTNKIISMNHKEIGFSYRNTNLKNKNYIVINAILKIPRNIDETILPSISYTKKRIEHQPIGKSCGSWFQNYKIKENNKLDKLFSNIKINSDNDKLLLEKIETGSITQIPAGWLIEQAGLKGFEKKGVIISPKHANFILNIDTNKGQNIYNMGQLAKNQVAEHFGVILTEEVKIIENL